MKKWSSTRASSANSYWCDVTVGWLVSNYYWWHFSQKPTGYIRVSYINQLCTSTIDVTPSNQIFLALLVKEVRINETLWFREICFPLAIFNNIASNASMDFNDLLTAVQQLFVAQTDGDLVTQQTTTQSCFENHTLFRHHTQTQKTDCVRGFVTVVSGALRKAKTLFYQLLLILPTSNCV